MKRYLPEGVGKVLSPNGTIGASGMRTGPRWSSSMATPLARSGDRSSLSHSSFDRSKEEWLRLLLSPLLAKGVAMEELQRGPVRIPDAPMVPFGDRTFPTPSGRYRFITGFQQPLRPRDEMYPYHLLTVSPCDWLCSELTPAEQVDVTDVRI